MEKGMKTVKSEGADAPTHRHTAVHPVKSAVTFRSIIYKATMKSEHRYFLFLE